MPGAGWVLSGRRLDSRAVGEDLSTLAGARRVLDSVNLASLQPCLCPAGGLGLKPLPP